jgi:hypothetical protein
MLDCWHWAAIIGLGLGFLSIAIKGVGLWRSARQIRTIADLSAEAEARTQQILDRMDRLDGEARP